MDWFSWLSKSNLEPSLIYDYGLAFTKNELQLEDISYFNHEFLQSMGISVAKHRLEILKLVRKEHLSSTRSLSSIFWAFGKTKKCFSKYFNKLVSHDEISSAKNLPEPIKYQEQWRGALLRKQRSEDAKEERPMVKTRSIALSGPLDGRVNERLMSSNTRSFKLSGPLDGRVNERLMSSNTRSFKLSGPIDGKIQERLMYANKSPMLSGPSLPLPPERLMISTTRSPKIGGTEEYGRTQDRYLNMTSSKSPRVSGQLDGRVSPKFISPYDNERVDLDYDEHSLWTTLFHDLKPT